MLGWEGITGLWAFFSPMILCSKCIFRYHGWFKQVRGPQRCTEIHSRWNNSCYYHHITSLYPFKIRVLACCEWLGWMTVYPICETAFRWLNYQIGHWGIKNNSPWAEGIRIIILLFSIPTVCVRVIVFFFCLCIAFLCNDLFTLQWSMAFQAGGIQVCILLGCSGPLRWGM